MHYPLKTHHSGSYSITHRQDYHLEETRSPHRKFEKEISMFIDPLEYRQLSMSLRDNHHRVKDD